MAPANIERRKVVSNRKSSARSDRKAKKPKKLSLKHQIRGKERSLAKLMQNASEMQEANSTLFEQQKLALESAIYTLKSQIERQGLSEMERKNAAKYRRIKFFERQKLTRMESRVEKALGQARQNFSNDDKKGEEHIRALEAELKQIRLDLQYIKYFPNDVKYLGLFPDGIYYKKGKANEQVEKQREEIRERVALRAASKDYHPTTKAKLGRNETVVERVRNALDVTHEMRPLGDEKSCGLTKKQEQKIPKGKIEEQTKESEKVRSSSDSVSDDSSSSCPSDDSSVSSSSEDSSSASSAADSSSASEIKSHENIATLNAITATETQPDNIEARERDRNSQNDESDDDFFASAQDVPDAKDVFEHAPVYKDGVGSASHDKSKGWATQKQRPGEFKKRRVRN